MSEKSKKTTYIDRMRFDCGVLYRTQVRRALNEFEAPRGVSIHWRETRTWLTSFFNVRIEGSNETDVDATTRTICDWVRYCNGGTR